MLFVAATAAVSALVALGTATSAPVALGHPFGVPQNLTEAGGAVAIYTVIDLSPCADPIPHPVAGRLYEATVAVEARRGNVTPQLAMVNARSAGGRNYRALSEVHSPVTLSANLLQQGQISRGRVYFDVTGEEPDGVVVNNGMADLLTWIGATTNEDAPQPQPPRYPSILQMVTPADTPVPA